MAEAGKFIGKLASKPGDDSANGITGLILAGGAGTRMGGVDKGLIDYRGRPLVAQVLKRLSPQVDSVLISANRHPDVYAVFGHPLVCDEMPDYPGPLAGLAAGLAACRTEWLLCVPCDCPALPEDLAFRLLQAARAAKADIAIAATAEGRQPTFQLCRRALLPALRTFMDAGERRVGGWCRAQNATEVLFDDAAAFLNLNTPADLAQ